MTKPSESWAFVAPFVVGLTIGGHAPAFEATGTPGTLIVGQEALGAAHDRAVECLTQAVYYEAASESRAGQQAVAQVVLNRVKHPAFPKSVCGVVYEGSHRSTGCQFTFTCDGSLSRRPMASKWAAAQSVAEDAMDGRADDVVGASTHYHASWMVPYWRSSMVETTRIGGHIFYRMAGRQGGAAALTQIYSGAEPSEPTPLVPSALAADRASGAGTRRAPPARPATFAVWGLQVATITPHGKQLVVRVVQ